MGDNGFAPITTQEEFDEAIKKRLAQQERKHKDEMAAAEAQHRDELERLKSEQKKELDEAKAKIKEQEGQIAKAAELKKQSEEQAAKIRAAEESAAETAKQIAERDARLKAYEVEAMKSKVVHEMGLPYDSAGFLKGEDEDGIRESAEALKGLVGSQAAPLAQGDPKPSGEDGQHKASMQTLLAGLNLKGD